MLAVLTEFHTTVGDILDAAGLEGGSCDLFEIKMAFDVVNRARARQANAPAEEDTAALQAPSSPVTRVGKRTGGAPPSPATRSVRRRGEEALEVFRQLPSKRPRPLGFAPGKVVKDGPGAVPAAVLAQLKAAEIAHCPPCAAPYLQVCKCEGQGLMECCLKEGSVLFSFLADEHKLAGSYVRGDGDDRDGASSTTRGVPSGGVVGGPAAIVEPVDTAAFQMALAAAARAGRRGPSGGGGGGGGGGVRVARGLHYPPPSPPINCFA